MKNLLVILLIVPLHLLSQDVEESNELLWEISGKGAKTSYLYGSLHSNDKRLFKLSDSTYHAMHNAEVISIEADIFSIFDWLDTRMGEVNLKYDNKGKPYSTSKEPSETLYGNEDGMPQFLDAYFQQYCYNSGKEFIALETVQSQVDIFDGVEYSPGLQRINYESMLTSKEDMIELYLKGDIYALNNFIRNSLGMVPDMYDELIVKRNLAMANKLDSLIQTKPLFCAVGAGHLAGGAGLINLLRSKGYKVRKVTASYSASESQAKTSVKNARDYDYFDDSLGIHIIFPGKPQIVNDAYDESTLQLVYRDLGQGNTYEVEIHQRTEEIGLEDLAAIHIPSTEDSPVEKIVLDNDGEAYQGLGQSYTDGLHWARVIMSEDVFIVIRAYGGNKFMSSSRPFRFFDNVWIE